MNLPLWQIRPMLAVSGAPFSSKDYIFEIKWDGYRAIAYLDGGTLIQSRNLKNLTPYFPELSNLHREVRGNQLVLDGEIVILAQGKPDFSKLQKRVLGDSTGLARASREFPALFVLFDILYYRGQRIMSLPLMKRKEILAEILPQPGDRVVLSQFVVEDGIILFKEAVSRGLEGVVGKHVTSPYLPGKRSPYWKKIKGVREEDFFVAGYILARDGRVGALLLALKNEKGELEPAGRVGVTLGREEGQRLLRNLESLACSEPTLKLAGEKEKIHWVQPKLLVTVEYLERTATGELRHPRLNRIRYDK